MGSGRSGTSLFAGLARELGFYVPQPEVEPDDTNPRGFAEPLWVVNFHTRLLRRVGVHSTADARPDAWAASERVGLRPQVRRRLSAWLQSQLDARDRIVIKDPRLLWFLPLWRACADELGVMPRLVTMLRDPAAVVVSKEQWYATLQNPANRMASWANTMLHTESETRGAVRSFVLFDDLLSDWRSALGKVGAQLSLPQLASPDAGQAGRADSFVDSSLKRAQGSLEALGLPRELTEIGHRTWQALTTLAADEGDGRARDSLDRLRVQYERYYRDAEAVTYSSIVAARRAGARSARRKAERTRQEQPTAEPGPVERPSSPPAHPWHRLAVVRRTLERLGRADRAGD